MIKIDESQVRSLLEELSIPVDKIDEFLSNLPKNEEEDERMKKNLERNGIHVETLKDQLEKEDDWKKKAALAARIISQGLE